MAASVRLSSVNVPPEVWMNIATFIPPLTVQQLFSVNRVFFELAMEQRYRQISFAYLTKHMLRMLTRLTDPVVAQRVRILHVHPHFVRDLLEKDALAISPTPSLRTRIYDLAKSITDHYSGAFKLQTRHKGAKRYRTSPSFKTSHDLVKVFLDVLHRLPNLEEYHIMWCGEGLSAIGATPVPFLAAPFTPSAIRKLSLDISLDKLGALFFPVSSNNPPHRIVLPSLEHLDITIRCDDDCSWEELLSSDSEGSSLQSCLSLADDVDSSPFSPLVNLVTDHRHTLRSLSLSSREPMDWSPFFFTLPLIPHLNDLSISIPAIFPHLGDPSALSFFLNSHGATLRNLTLRVTELSSDGIRLRSLTSFPALADDEGLDAWIQNVICQATLPVLRRLDLTSSLLPHGTAVACARQFSGTLRHLLLTGRLWTCPEIEAVVAQFDEPGLKGVPRPLGKLRVLRLGTVMLCPELMDLVAERLPYLRRLELTVKDVVPAKDDCVIYYKERYPGGVSSWQDESQIAEFLDRMSQRHYKHWQLNTLGLMRSTFPFGLEPKLEYWETLSRCIPRLVSFI